jgi:hypothetical protein
MPEADAPPVAPVVALLAALFPPFAKTKALPTVFGETQESPPAVELLVLPAPTLTTYI